MEESYSKSDKTQSATLHEEIGVTLAKRGVDIEPGSVTYYQQAPQGFMTPGWYYTADNELLFLGRNKTIALETAQTGQKNWGGKIGMAADKKMVKSSSGAAQQAKMTWTEKLSQAATIIATGSVLGTGIGALEESGHNRMATGAKVTVGILGIAAQGSSSRTLQTAGLLALGGLTYDAAKTNVAPLAGMMLPQAASKEEEEETPLAALDESRDARLELVTESEEVSSVTTSAALAPDSEEIPAHSEPEPIAVGAENVKSSSRRGARSSKK